MRETQCDGTEQDDGDVSHECRSRVKKDTKFADDKMWAEIVTESSELGKKYDNCGFITALTMNEVNEFEKISKSVHPIQN